MEFALQLWGEEAYQHLFYSVFYKKGGKRYFDSYTDLSPLLKKHFKSYLDAAIGVQQYRTLAAAVARHLGVEHLMDQPDDVTEGLQGQMGHSLAIADLHYGLEPGDAASDNARTRAIHENASRLWHCKFLGLCKATSIEEKPVETTEARLEALESRFGTIESKLSTMDEKMTVIADKLADIWTLLSSESQD